MVCTLPCPHPREIDRPCVRRRPSSNADVAGPTENRSKFRFHLVDVGVFRRGRCARCPCPHPREIDRPCVRRRPSSNADVAGPTENRSKLRFYLVDVVVFGRGRCARCHSGDGRTFDNVTHGQAKLAYSTGSSARPTCDPFVRLAARILSALMLLYIVLVVVVLGLAVALSQDAPDTVCRGTYNCQCAGAYSIDNCQLVRLLIDRNYLV